MAADSFDEDGFLAFPDGKVNMLSGDLVEILHEGKRDIAKSSPLWHEDGDFPELYPNVVTIVIVPFQEATGHQLSCQPVSGGEWQFSSPREFAEGKRGIIVGERRQ